MCIVIPTLFVLIAWWWPKCKKCQCVQESNTKEEMGRIIMSAIIMGIQKVMSKYPKTKGFIDDMLNALNSNNKK